jgi:site-specific DNA-methyltransferase (adenine-specific)
VIELSHKPLIRAFNCDCLEFMADKPDGCWDLAICDPPFNVGACDGKFGNRLHRYNGAKTRSYSKTDHLHKYANHDKVPDGRYFSELFRTSKNQIIWGSNYYPQHLYHSGAIIWHKKSDNPMSDCEIAFQSFNKLVKYYWHEWQGFLKGGETTQRIHTNQKPVALYRWLLANYAKPGQTIFDSHGGSFSSAIACWKEGYDMDICELDTEYFEAACERFERETKQMRLF